MGVWSVVKAMRRTNTLMKGDERILGDGDFVEKVLRQAQEKLTHSQTLKLRGYDYDWLVKHVANVMGIEPGDVVARGKSRQFVKARALLCYWGTRDFGMTTIELAKKLHLAQPTINQAAMRGRDIVQKEGLILLEPINQ
jgi:chromosomal replication initiation ATPase DnaA